MDDNKYWYWLMNCKGIGMKRIQLLLEQFKTVQSVFKAPKAELIKVPNIGKECVNAILEHRSLDWIENEHAKLKEKGICFVARKDMQFPKKLLNYPDAPYGLYYRGKMPDESKMSIAIVGARQCSIYGKEMASWFSRELSRAGIQVISGLARGVDSYSHYGALQGNTSTYGVLGSGIDICYPPEHYNLYRELIQTGGIISEYGLGVQAFAGNFPMRNRIISGLCDGILVVEAKDRSGSLITADMGLEQGKDIFAIPGRIGDALSYGCNRLIKLGAYPVLSPEDILTHYHFNCNENVKEFKKNNNLLETREKIVYANLSYQPKHVNELLDNIDIEYEELLESLMSLELKGFIKQTMKNFYIIYNE